MREPIELSVQECLDRLATEVFGRLAFTTPGGPRIVPVNYVLIDDNVVFRTTPYSEVATHAMGKAVAFEVDQVDYGRQIGWSVVVHGTLEEVDLTDLEDQPSAWVPQPWAGGVRNLHVRVRGQMLTGRRLRDDSISTPPPRRVL